MLGQENHPPLEETKCTKPHENPSKELSINHFWDLCSLFEEEEEQEVEEIQTSQHSYNTKSKGSISSTNAPSSATTSIPKPDPPKKVIVSSPATSDSTVTKNNKSIFLVLDFSIVDELKRTRVSISLFELAKIT